MRRGEGEIPDNLAPPAEELLFQRPQVSDVSAALNEADIKSKQHVSPVLVYGLSDLTSTEWGELECAWKQLSATVRLRTLRALNESSEALFELNYRELASQCLNDRSAAVREAAIELLWTDESEQTMRELISLAQQDKEPAVCTAAVKALGRFVLLGEYGDVSEDLAQEAQQLSLGIYLDQSKPLELRRRALETLANSSHPSAPELISSAYADGNHDLKISAIFAMGRTCSRHWQEILLQELDGDDNEAVYEATSACGQIQLEDSVPRIGELALSDDREIQVTAIWALGEIGGRRASEILSHLAEVVEDDETLALLDEALATAGFHRSFATLDSCTDSE